MTRDSALGVGRSHGPYSSAMKEHDRRPWLRRHPQTIGATVVAVGVLVALVVGLITDRFLVGLVAGGIVAVVAMFLGPLIAFFASRHDAKRQGIAD